MTKTFAVLFLLLALMSPGWAQGPEDVTPAPDVALPAPTAAPPTLPKVPPVPAPTTPVLHSHYAVLVDAVTGKVLWERNANVRRPIASTTKMMTAILLLEKGDPNAIVTAPNAVKGIQESSLHLSPGETIPLHDLLYAMLLRSANDTAVAGAYYLAGSLPAFADMMNAKAKAIGATNTHFVTPNGLYAPGHYSTAADLAKIAGYAVNNLPEFNEIVKTQKYEVQRSMHTGDVWVKNTASKFLKTFPGGDGIKTGYVREAGHCFVGSATRNHWRLIAVALDSGTCREDVESLLNYGFHNFVPTVAVHRDAGLGTMDVPNASGAVSVRAANDVKVIVSRWKPVPRFQTQLVPLSPMPQAPVAAGTKLGTFVVLLAGKPQATGDALAADQVALRPALALIKTTRHLGHSLAQMAGTALGVCMLFFLGVMIYARTASKGARVRGDRLAAGLRGVDQAGPGPR